MKKLNHFLFPSIILLIFLSSCATPSPVVRLVPKENQTTWEQGKQFVSYQKNDFTIHCAYHGIDSKYLIFDVEVINNSPEDFLLAPEQFIMYTDSGKWDAISNQLVYSTFPIKAADPEHELLKLEMQESVTIAKMKNNQTAAAVVAIAAIPVIAAAAISDANDSKNDEGDEDDVSRTEVAATTTVVTLDAINDGQANHLYNMGTISDNQNVWQQYALRKTTLGSGESLRGLIYFPKPNLELYKDLRIEAPIPNNNIYFNYSVILYYPSINQPQ